MAQLAVQNTGNAGAVALVAATPAGDSFQNTGQQRLVVNNAGGAPQTIKILGGARACNFGVAGTPAHDIDYIIPAGVRWEFSPFPEAPFNDGNGFVQIRYPGGGANITVGVYQGAR
jgi:hypothetical protein